MNALALGLLAFASIFGQKAALPEPVRAVAYSPDGGTIYAAQGPNLIMLSSRDGMLLKKIPSGAEQVNSIAISRDGKKLAVAVGKPGVSGKIMVFNLAKDPVPLQAEFILDAHKDLVHDLAFHPQGDLLASGGYDRLVKVWSIQGRKVVVELKDHSDAVNAVGFNHDGTLFASSGSDRAVKVWEVPSWKKLHTLSEPTDWMYSLHWHPTKNLIAGAGVDQSIRVWNISKDGVKLENSVFAHSAPVRQVRWNGAGNQLVSIGEDKSWKVWDAVKYTVSRTQPGLADTPFCLAVHPKLQQFMVGRMDSKLEVFESTSGKMVQALLPARLPKPVATVITPAFLHLGAKARVTVEGSHLPQVASLESSDSAVRLGVPVTAKGGAVTFDVVVGDSAAPGSCKISLKTASGETLAWTLEIDRFARINEGPENDSRGNGQKVPFPVTIKAALARAGDCDWYVFERKKGQEIAAQLHQDADSKNFSPVLTLHSPDGKLIQESHQGLLAHVCSSDGSYALEVRDREFRGGDTTGAYRLHMGEFPLVTSVFPRGWKTGVPVSWKIEGVGLAGKNRVTAAIPQTHKPGDRVPLSQFLGNNVTGASQAMVVASDLSEVLFESGTQPTAIPVPGVGNAEFASPRETHVWQIPALKGQRLILETQASRIGNQVDTFLEVLDANGQPLPQALLQGTARTFTIFRDHDSANPGIRIESWNDLAVNDFVLIGADLMRIRALPRNPDDDCRFYQLDGKRLGYLGTTPTHHYLGQPLVKIAFHPPGTILPPNGLPQVTLFHQNDDGGPRLGKDSLLVFDPPADGKYLVRVREMQDRHGNGASYRLVVRKPNPDFEVRLSPSGPAVPRGNGIPMNLDLVRLDEFDGPVDVTIQGLPAGFHAPRMLIPQGEVSANFSLFAAADAPEPARNTPDLIVHATATIQGKKVEKTLALKAPSLTAAGDIQTMTGVEILTVQAGTETKLPVTIERRNGFSARVPLDVLGLPHGARVLNVGLNGILVTPAETKRTIDIQVDSWLQPGEYPFVVLAKQEGKGGQFAAKSVILKVVR